MAIFETMSVATPAGRLVCHHTGDGPPVLLFHGWGGSSRYWLGVMAALRDRYSLFAPDLPGFGDSPPLSGPITLARIADVMAALADTLGLQYYAVIGHSFGAGVAAMLAARRPAQVARVVLTSFGLPRDQAEQNMLHRFHAQLMMFADLWRPWLALWQPWLSAARPLLALQWSTPPIPQLLAQPYLYHFPENPALLQAGVADLVRMDARTAFESGASIGDPEVETAVRAIAAPTLVISGRYDHIFPADSVQALARAVPKAYLVMFDRCGHVPMIEQPALFHNVMYEFLR